MKFKKKNKFDWSGLGLLAGVMSMVVFTIIMCIIIFLVGPYFTVKFFFSHRILHLVLALIGWFLFITAIMLGKRQDEVFNYDCHREDW